MKKFRLDLSEWKVTMAVPKPTEEEPHAMGEENVVYPFRENINIWLRSVGVFRSGEEIAEAVVLAKTIRDCKEDSMELDERETQILKTAVNRHVELAADGKNNLGGPLHEEAICRIMTMREAK